MAYIFGWTRLLPMKVKINAQETLTLLLKRDSVLN